MSTFTARLPPNVEMDDVEDAFAELDGFEVVGAGGGDLGSNIDLEVTASIPRADALREVAASLASSTWRISHTSSRQIHDDPSTSPTSCRDETQDVRSQVERGSGAPSASEALADVWAIGAAQLRLMLRTGIVRPRWAPTRSRVSACHC
jgi:hypothetical protein